MPTTKTTPTKKALNKLVRAALKKAPTAKPAYRIPDNVSETDLRSVCPEGIDAERWISACYYVMGTIQSRLTKKTGRLYYRGDRHTNLYSGILKQNLGPHYAKILKHMEEAELIQCDGKWSRIFGKSRGFRLHPKYRGQNLEWKLITCPFMKGQLQSWQKQENKALIKRALPLGHLVQWLADGKLVMDKDAGWVYLYAVYKSFQRHITSATVWSIKEKEELLKQADHRYAFYQRTLDSFETQIANVWVDKSGGRLYSGLTAIMSGLRNFCTYDGRSLVSFDIKNSQPVHLMLCLEPEFWYNRQSARCLKMLDPDLFDELQAHHDSRKINKGAEKDTHSASTKVSIKLIKGMQSIVNEKNSETDFFRKVKSGGLYEFFMEDELFGGQFFNKGVDRFGTREKAKKEFMRLMYFDPAVAKYNIETYAPWYRFEKLFPSVARIMEVLKTGTYRNFPVLLQRLEAKILLHKVCREIWKADPSIPVFTVHDSIITTADRADEVKAIVDRWYKEIFGFEVRFERNDLTPTAAYDDLNKYVQTKLSIVDAPDDSSEGIDLGRGDEEFDQGGSSVTLTEGEAVLF